MMKPLTRRELDAVKCTTPGCDHSTHDKGGLLLKAACHARGGTIVAYENGVVTVTCAICTRFVVAIVVQP